MKRLLPCFLLACLAGCNPALTNTSSVLYFDMKALLHKHITQLKARNPSIRKFIRHDKQRENNIVEIANWAQELHIFEEANLNRPIFKDAYTTVDSTAQSTRFRTFVAKHKHLQVRHLRLAYQNDRLASIEAKLLIENILYQSEKHLHLHFQPDETLASYNVRGKMQIIYGAKHDYEIDAIVK